MSHRFAIATLLLLTAGCAVTAPVRQTDATLPAAFESQPAEAAAIPLDRWWTAYSDEQLTALIEEALANAPEAELALARLEEARATRLANIRSAFPRGDLNLNLSQRGNQQLSGAQTAFQSEGTSLSMNLGFDVSWELDVWGRRRVGRQGIEDDFAAKVFAIEGARASLAANVADALFSARALAQQIVDAAETARIASEVQRIAQLRAERGLAAFADARRAAADVGQAEAAIVQLEGELAATKRSLLVLLGRGTAPLASLPIATSPAAPPPPPAAVPGEILQRRPDVREAEERLQVAIAQYRVARIDLFPRFTLMPGVGLTRTTQDSFTGFDASGDPVFGRATSLIASWSLGAGLTVPVLDRPRLLAEARASGARAEQAAIAYEAAVQRAYGEADTALLQLGADRERLIVLERAESDARAAYEAARLRYDAGLDDLTVLLSAEQGWRQARQQVTAARSQAMRRSVQVFKALGGGWSPGDDFEV